MHSLGRYPARLVDSISVSLDAEAAVHRADAWRVATEIAFEEVARELGAFFGAAHLESGWIGRRGVLWAVQITERDTTASCGGTAGWACPRFHAG